MAFAGYTYPTVEIDGQCLFAANLRTDEYANSDPISSAWDDDNEGQVAANDDPSKGKFYNLAAVTDVRNICPANWHVWTDAEAQQIISFAGGLSVAGDKLKAGPDDSPAYNGSNNYGFSATASGTYTGSSIVSQSYEYYWTAPSLTEPGFLRFDSTDAIAQPGMAPGDDGLGMHVRCALDTP